MLSCCLLQGLGDAPVSMASLGRSGTPGRCTPMHVRSVESDVMESRRLLQVEAANGPTTEDGDKVLRERGITVLPDIIANGGGGSLQLSVRARKVWQACCGGCVPPSLPVLLLAGPRQLQLVAPACDASRTCRRRGGLLLRVGAEPADLQACSPSLALHACSGHALDVYCGMWLCASCFATCRAL